METVQNAALRTTTPVPTTLSHLRHSRRFGRYNRRPGQSSNIVITFLFVFFNFFFSSIRRTSGSCAVTVPACYFLIKNPPDFDFLSAKRIARVFETRRLSPNLRCPVPAGKASPEIFVVFFFTFHLKIVN